MLSMTQINECLLAILFIVLLFKVSLSLWNDISERYKNANKTALLEKKKKIEKALKEAKRDSIFCKLFIDELKNSAIGVYQGKSNHDYELLLLRLKKTVLDKTVELEKVNKLLTFYE
jgi:hypothetical protein